MTKPKGVFKKRVNKGNRYYRISTPNVCELVNNVESRPSTSQNSRPISDPSSTRPTLVSASKRKLSSEFVSTNDGSVNVIFDLNLLVTSLTNSLACKLCKGEVTITEKVSMRCGLASCFVIHCNVCEAETVFWNSDMYKKKDKLTLFDINTRLFYGMRCIGRGLTATKTLCGILNISPPLCRTKTLLREVGKALQSVADESMKKAVFEAVEQNETTEENSLGLDIPIAFDATWQKRGHVSKNACATITSFDTGKVLDVEVLSKYCHTCTLKKANADAPNHICMKNYDGSSGGMETVAAVSMFHRSQQTRGVRYTKFLGDGDSSAFITVCNSKPYNTDICKLECIGHVQKRMGTRLRKLKSAKSGVKLSDGKTLKGAGRLPDSLIDKIQDYYGKAIRNNCNNLDGMIKAVWAIWFHRISTDEKPQHHLCDENWCGYKKAQVKGETYKHKPTPEPVMLEIKPIFRDLASKELLKKCLHGKTQNVNESFNNVVWSRVPKNTFVGKETLDLGVWDAVCTYNDGCVSRLSVLKQCGIKDIGKNTEAAMNDTDILRIKKAQIAAQQVTKEARTARRRRRLMLNDPDEEQDYIPGGF
jgi:hypothetical protein